jgi:hypothetical protein
MRFLNYFCSDSSTFTFYRLTVVYFLKIICVLKLNINKRKEPKNGQKAMLEIWKIANCGLTGAV